MTTHLDVVSDTSISIGVMPPSRNGRRFTPQTSQPAGSQPEAVHSRAGVLAERLPREHRHWSPESQVYAPGDALAHLISDGWQVYGKVIVQTYACLSRSCTQVYHFVLVRNDEHLDLRVVANPAVRRLVQERQFPVEGAI